MQELPIPFLKRSRDTIHRVLPTITADIIYIGQDKDSKAYDTSRNEKYIFPLRRAPPRQGISHSAAQKPKNRS